MKVTVWVLMSTGNGSDDAQVFTTHAAAYQEAETMTKAAWERSHTDPMPDDWEDAQQQMLDASESYLFCEITHHDLDLVELIEAQKLPMQKAAPDAGFQQADAA